MPYGFYFQHNNTESNYGEIVIMMNNEVYTGQKSMPDALREFNQRANQEVEYGNCLPYRGMAVPIKP